MEKQIALRVQNLELESLSGWVVMEGADQIALREETAGIIEEKTSQGFSMVKEAQRLAHAKQIIEKYQAMSFKEWVRRLYGNSERTAYQRLVDWDNWQKLYPERVLAFLAGQGLALMPYTNVSLAEFSNAAKTLPMPKPSAEDTVIEAWVKQVGEKYREIKRRRRKVGLSLEAEISLRTGVLTVSRLLRQSRLKNTTEQREWLEKLVGWVMADRAIPGKVTTSQIPLPENFRPPRGRPPGTRRRPRLPAALAGKAPPPSNGKPPQRKKRT